ncbi:putative WRKY transcription factor 19 [Phytophthora ramorum]|uniref:putative WRKY transcription factor 19 n=1 Tax=Phytophthora ramorum TaxID=164328 RepID=UPI0030B5CA7F|nr:putative WRKY transcription factor 19 [Phytophthora ramorum]
MAVASDGEARRARGKKRPQSGSIAPAKSKKIGRPAGEGSQCTHPGCANKAQSRGKCRTHTGGGKCIHPDCDKQAQFRGLCAAHGGRRICTAPDCDKKVVSKGKCADHGGGRQTSTRRRTNGSRAQSRDFASLPTAPYQQVQGHESMMSLLVGNAWPPEPAHEVPGDITEFVLL